jgi:hypothetical protein
MEDQMRWSRVKDFVGVVAVAAIMLPLVAVALVSASASPDGAAVFEGPVASAKCGKGSLPETGLQGQVPLADRQSGRSTKGYRCNLELVGRYQGEGTSWVSQSYGNCAYLPTRYPSTATSPGVQVIDVSDPANPQLVDTLTSPAMLGPWESLKVNPGRGLLAAVYAPGPVGNGAAFFDVYDIKTDCRHPRLLNSVSTTDLSVPANVLGHEGNWAPDGKTYWSAGLSAGAVTAIDVSNAATPEIAFTGSTSTINHGLSLSDDGNRLYIAQVGLPGAGLLQRNGVQIIDVSEVQARKPLPRIREVGQVTWADGGLGQHAIRVTYAGHPYLIFVDEGGAGAARIIDISDEGVPRVVSKLKLQIHMAEHADARAEDTGGSRSFEYEAHYCDVDRRPTRLPWPVGTSSPGSASSTSATRWRRARSPTSTHPPRPARTPHCPVPSTQGLPEGQAPNSPRTGAPRRRDSSEPSSGSPARTTASWCCASPTTPTRSSPPCPSDLSGCSAKPSKPPVDNRGEPE